MHRVPPAAIHDRNGTWTPCGVLPVFLPVRPVVGPVRGMRGPPRDSPCPPGPVPLRLRARAGGASPLPQDGWTDREGEEGAAGEWRETGRERTNEYIYIDEYEYEYEEI